MYHSVYEMVHIKDPLLVIRKSSPWSSSSAFLLQISEWSFTLYLMTNYHKKIVLCVSLNKTLFSVTYFDQFCYISRWVWDVIHLWRFHPMHGGSLDQYLLMEPASYFLLLLMLHNWCNKEYGRDHPVYVILLNKTFPSILCFIRNYDMFMDANEFSKISKNIYRKQTKNSLKGKRKKNSDMREKVLKWSMIQTPSDVFDPDLLV